MLDDSTKLLRIQIIAEETFGSADKACIWLRRPLAELHGETPLNLAQTKASARVVELILTKIA